MSGHSFFKRSTAALIASTLVASSLPIMPLGIVASADDSTIPTTFSDTFDRDALLAKHNITGDTNVYPEINRAEEKQLIEPLDITGFDTWDGTFDGSFLLGHAGTEDDPIIISSAEELMYLYFSNRTPGGKTTVTDPFSSVTTTSYYFAHSTTRPAELNNPGVVHIENILGYDNIDNSFASEEDALASAGYFTVDKVNNTKPQDYTITDVNITCVPSALKSITIGTDTLTYCTVESVNLYYRKTSLSDATNYTEYNIDLTDLLREKNAPYFNDPTRTYYATSGIYSAMNEPSLYLTDVVPDADWYDTGFSNDFYYAYFYATDAVDAEPHYSYSFPTGSDVDSTRSKYMFIVKYNGNKVHEYNLGTFDELGFEYTEHWKKVSLDGLTTTDPSSSPYYLSDTAISTRSTTTAPDMVTDDNLKGVGNTIHVFGDRYGQGIDSISSYYLGYSYYDDVSNYQPYEGMALEDLALTTDLYFSLGAVPFANDSYTPEVIGTGTFDSNYTYYYKLNSDTVPFPYSMDLVTVDPVSLPRVVKDNHFKITNIYFSTTSGTYLNIDWEYLDGDESLIDSGTSSVLASDVRAYLYTFGISDITYDTNTHKVSITFTLSSRSQRLSGSTTSTSLTVILDHTLETSCTLSNYLDTLTVSGKTIGSNIPYNDVADQLTYVGHTSTVNKGFKLIETNVKNKAVDICSNSCDSVNHGFYTDFRNSLTNTDDLYFKLSADIDTKAAEECASTLVTAAREAGLSEDYVLAVLGEYGSYWSGFGGNIHLDLNGHTLVARYGVLGRGNYGSYNLNVFYVTNGTLVGGAGRTYQYVFDTCAPCIRHTSISINKRYEFSNVIYYDLAAALDDPYYADSEPLFEWFVAYGSTFYIASSLTKVPRLYDCNIKIASHLLSPSTIVRTWSGDINPFGPFYFCYNYSDNPGNPHLGTSNKDIFTQFVNVDIDFDTKGSLIGDFWVFADYIDNLVVHPHNRYLGGNLSVGWQLNNSDIYLYTDDTPLREMATDGQHFRITNANCYLQNSYTTSRMGPISYMYNSRVHTYSPGQAYINASPCMFVALNSTLELEGSSTSQSTYIGSSSYCDKSSLDSWLATDPLFNTRVLEEIYKIKPDLKVMSVQTSSVKSKLDSRITAGFYNSDIHLCGDTRGYLCVGYGILHNCKIIYDNLVSIGGYPAGFIYNSYSNACVNCYVHIKKTNTADLAPYFAYNCLFEIDESTLSRRSDGYAPSPLFSRGNYNDGGIFFDCDLIIHKFSGLWHGINGVWVDSNIDITFADLIESYKLPVHTDLYGDIYTKDLNLNSYCFQLRNGNMYINFADNVHGYLNKLVSFSAFHDSLLYIAPMPSELEVFDNGLIDIDSYTTTYFSNYLSSSAPHGECYYNYIGSYMSLLSTGSRVLAGTIIAPHVIVADAVPVFALVDTNGNIGWEKMGDNDIRDPSELPIHCNCYLDSDGDGLYDYKLYTYTSPAEIATANTNIVTSIYLNPERTFNATGISACKMTFCKGLNINLDVYNKVDNSIADVPVYGFLSSLYGPSTNGGSNYVYNGAALSSPAGNFYNGIIMRSNAINGNSALIAEYISNVSSYDYLATGYRRSCPAMLSDCYLYLPNAPTSVDLEQSSIDAALPGLIGELNVNPYNTVYPFSDLAIMSYMMNPLSYLIDDCYVARGQSKAWRTYRTADNKVYDAVDTMFAASHTWNKQGKGLAALLNDSTAALERRLNIDFYNLSDYIVEHGGHKYLKAVISQDEVAYLVDLKDALLAFKNDLETTVTVPDPTTREQTELPFEYNGYTLYFDAEHWSNEYRWNAYELNWVISHIDTLLRYGNETGLSNQEVFDNYIAGEVAGVYEIDPLADASGELAYMFDDGDDLYLRHGYFTVVEPDTFIMNVFTGEKLFELPCQTWVRTPLPTETLSSNAHLTPIFKTSVKPAANGALTLKGLNGTKTSDSEIYTKQDTYIVDSVTTESNDILLAYALEEVGEGAPIRIDSTPLIPIGTTSRQPSVGTLSRLAIFNRSMLNRSTPLRNSGLDDDDYTLAGYKQPAMNTRLTPVFKTKRYIDVQVTDSEHGTVIPSTYVSYEGEEITIAYDCDPGYIVQNIQVNGIPLASEMFFMPDEDVVITGDCVPFEGGITKFTLLGQNGIIDQIAGTIDVTVPRSIYLSNALPFIDYYGDYLIPDEHARVDFSDAENNPVLYTVYYGDNQTKDYVVTVHQTKYAQRINDFVLDGVHGRIDQANKKITVIIPSSSTVNLSNIAPDDIAYSAEVITPEIDVARDFTVPQTYTLNTTGMTPVQYTVYVQAAAPDDAYITDFVISGYSGEIDEVAGTITFNVPKLVTFDYIEPSLISYVGRSISPLKTTAQNFEESPTYTVTALSGKTRNYTVVVNHIEDNEAHIDTFKLAGYDGVIDQTRKIITVTVPERTNVANIAPDELTYTGKTIYPRVTDIKDYSDDTNPVMYTVVSPDNTEVVYTVRIVYEVLPDYEALLLDYGVRGYKAVINQDTKTVTLTFPSTLDVTNATPDVFRISDGATPSPLPTVAHDYHDDFTYVITSRDNAKRNIYTVHSTFATEPPPDIPDDPDPNPPTPPNPPTLNNEALLLQYGVNGYTGVINQVDKTVTLSFPTGVDVTNAVPDVFVTSFGASANPSQYTAHDYHQDFAYVITSQDGKNHNTYTIHSEFPNPLSEDARIVEFSIDGHKGIIDQTQGIITINLPNTYTNTDISNKVPDITWIGKTIVPSDRDAQDFNNRITYTVYAENTAVRKSYDVYTFIEDMVDDKPWYDIILKDDPHGEIRSNVPKAHEGDIVEIWVTPDPGYEPDSFKVDNVEKLPETRVIFPMPPHNVTAEVKFKELPVYYNIIIERPLNGTITSTHSKATPGTTVTVTASPKSDYELKSFIVDYGENAPKSTVSFNMPEHDVHVSARFDRVPVEDKPKYKIITNDPEHGDIDSSVPEAYEGEEVRIWLTPDPGYKPESFTVDDVDELPAYEVIIEMPPRDVIANAEFTEILYKLITDDTEHGQIIPSVPEAPEGEEVWIKIIPDDGYKPDNFIVDDTDRLPSYKVYFDMPPRDVYASADFSEILYHIVVDQNEHGKVTSSHEWAPAGELVTITLKPDPGYEPKRFDIDKDNKLPSLTYTFVMPPRDVIVTVRFGEIDDDGFVPTGVSLGIGIPIVAAAAAFATRKRKKK